MSHSVAFQKLVDDRRNLIRETNPDEVKARMDKGEKIILIDVREESEWNAGHLPDAIHIGKGIIERDIEKFVPDKSAEVILYCGGGFRSVIAGDNLRIMGYQNIVSMDGGWREWKARGYPTE